MADGSTRRARVAGAVAAVLVAGLAARYFATRRRVPADPRAYVPPSARGVLVADLARLRTSRYVGRWLAREDGANEPCEAALARKVRTMVFVTTAFPVTDFGVAMAGDLSREELLRCAARRAGGRNEVVEERYRGYPLVRIVPRAGGVSGLRPPPVAEVVYLPGGVVVAGGGEVVRRMIDRGLSGDDPRANPLDALRARAGGTHAVQAAAWVDRARGDATPWRHVVGVSVGLDAEEGVDADVALACDDADGARDVALALGRTRDGLTGPLRDWVEGARVDARGAEVRVRISLGPRRLDALLDGIASAAEALAREPPPPDPPAP